MISLFAFDSSFLGKGKPKTKEAIIIGTKAGLRIARTIAALVAIQRKQTELHEMVNGHYFLAGALPSI